MMWREAGALAASGLWVGVALLAQAPGPDPARPDYSGTWVLDVGASLFGPLEAPTGRTDVVEHQDPDLRIVRTQTRGQRVVHSTITCKIGSPPCTSAVEGMALSLETVAEWENDRLRFGSRGTFNGEDITVDETWAVEPGGATIVVVRRLASADGVAHQRLVLARR